MTTLNTVLARISLLDAKLTEAQEIVEIIYDDIHDIKKKPEEKEGD